MFESMVNTLVEGKIRWDGKYLKFPDGEFSSMPGKRDEDAVLLVHPTEPGIFKIYINHEGKPYLTGSRWDKDFSSMKELINYLNKEGFEYDGIDDRW